jgi:hypothetical protein
MNVTVLKIAAIAAGFALAAPALAQGTGKGPVAKMCQPDIEKFCAGKVHGQGAVRGCLEDNKAKVSLACASALNSTGPGRRR